MKNLKSNFLWLAIIGMLFTVVSCEKDDMQDALNASAKKSISTLEDCKHTVDLVAGRDLQVVGTVDVVVESGVITVTYNTIDDWLISETHVHLFTDDNEFSDVPLTKKGSPKIGNFDYKAEHFFVNKVTVTIDDEIEIWDFLFVAAHAVVSTGSGVEFIASKLPETVSFSVKNPGSDLNSYFDVTVSGDTYLDGLYAGFCVDAERTIDQGVVYTANVYSSYDEELPENAVDSVKNLDLVNWIFNEDFTTKESFCASRNYTYGDISLAIWMIVDDETSTNGLGLHSECAAKEIVMAAREDGEDFVPGCGEYMGILLIPIEPKQKIMIWKKVPCGEDETAWGFGDEFDGRDWSMYFKACDK